VAAPPGTVHGLEDLSRPRRAARELPSNEVHALTALRPLLEIRFLPGIHGVVGQTRHPGLCDPLPPSSGPILFARQPLGLGDREPRQSERLEPTFTLLTHQAQPYLLHEIVRRIPRHLARQ
jgi:hypothetical protein